MHPAIETIVTAFEQKGSGRYGSEAVSQLEHALQCAELARREGASRELVAAALLHDVGHILIDAGMPTNERENYDDRHEATGFRYLQEHFGPAVVDPVRLHVLAKRYLCTVEPEYERFLSPTSQKSYRDQGGELSDEERRRFEAEPQFAEAVRLRRWDDAAKDPSMVTPTLSEFLGDVEACMRPKA